MSKSDSSVSASGSRYGHNKAWIQQTAAPALYNTMPPSTNHPSAVFKKVTVDHSFTVPMLPINAVQQALPGTGLILWFPKLGVDTILHQGIIPQNTACVREVNTAGFSNNNVTLSVNSLSNSIQTNSSGNMTTGVSAFIFTKALAVPRLDAVIKIDPPLQKTFSQSRVYGGEISIWSDTVAGGNLNLTGTCAAAVISDTRDICQSEDGVDAYAWTSLNQAARTWKECTNEITVADGVTTIQGSDIAPDFSAPDSLNDVRMFGGWDNPYQYPTITRTCDFSQGPSVNTAGRAQIPIMSAWYSPCAVNQSEGFGNQGVGTSAYAFTAGILPDNAIVIPTLAETSTVQVKFDAHLNISNVVFAGGAVPDTFGVSFDVVVEHYFCGLMNSYGSNTSIPVVGAPNIRVLRTVRSITGKVEDFGGDPSGVPSTQLETQAPTTLSCYSNIDDEYIKKGGAPLFGKFIGCKIYVCARAYGGLTGETARFDVNLFSYAPLTKDQGVTDFPNAYADNITGPQIAFLSPEINQEGTCGPCHIIRYSDVGGGQQVRINGMLNTQSVAKGSLAPFVQDQVMNAKIAEDVNVLPLTWILYNGDTEFKMSWERPLYRQWINTFIRHLGTETFSDIAEGDSRAATAMDAAGLFSGIIGGLGNAIGGTLDSIVGGSGQFGASARGQFGASGQYGSCARGQFGATGQFGDEAETRAGGAFNSVRRTR